MIVAAIAFELRSIFVPQSRPIGYGLWCLAGVREVAFGGAAFRVVTMVPLVGVFAAAAVAGAGVMVGWRLARDHLLPSLAAKKGRDANGDGGHAKVIEADYVDLTDRSPKGAGRRSRGAG